MNQTSKILLLAGAAVSLGGTALAEQTAWSGTNADEVRAIVAEMLSDAQTRSSLLANGATAGYDKNFFLASADGNFRLNVSGIIQFRYLINFREDARTVGAPPAVAPVNDDFVSGFQTRRTKLNFEGNIFDPNLFYRVRGDFARDGGAAGGNFRLDFAYAGYKFDNGFTATWGQFRVPFNREELVGDQYQLAVERSVISSIFQEDYSQGVMLGWEGEQLRAAFAFTNGFRSRNTDIGNSGATKPADYALTGRLEWLFSGAWNDMKQFTSPQGSNFAGMFGAAIHWQESPDSPAVANRQRDLRYTADITVKGDGWNVFGAFHGAHTEQEFNVAPANGTTFDDFGFVAQGGVYVTDKFEPFIRYEYLLTDKDRGNGNTRNQHIIGGGFNYYMHGQAAKFSADVLYFINDTNLNVFTRAGVPGFGSGGSPLDSGNGLLSGDGRHQLAFRLQFQLLF